MDTSAHPGTARHSAAERRRSRTERGARLPIALDRRFASAGGLAYPPAFIGQAPLLYATGSGADVKRPLAVVVMGGLVTSTLLTLLVLPSLYALTRRRGEGGAQAA